MTVRVRQPAASAWTEGTQPVVALRDVFCVHRTGQGDAAALQGASLEVAAGELVCILGPSGAGKSTLLRVMAGLQIPSAGRVLVFGTDVGRLSTRRRAQFRHGVIGLVSQQSHSVLTPELPIEETVARPLALRGAPRRAQRRRAQELLAAAGLADRVGARPSELSGGERQRVSFCAALAHRPPLLLADEPTGELDAATAESVRTALAELIRTSGTTAIIVSHDPASATIADRSLVLRDGRVAVEQRPGHDGMLVTRDGWLHVPQQLLAAAGISRRAQVRLTGREVIITGDEEPVGDLRREGGLPSSDPSWQAAGVELSRLTQRRGAREVLGGLDRRLAPGGLTAVAGPSGVGKTTLLALVAGLETPDGGEVVIDGRSLAQCGAEERAALRRERIGYLPQEPVAVGFLSAMENIVLTLRIRNWDQQRASQRAALILDWLGLSARADQRVARLSAGETQRVALGRALAGARGLLIVDEPTSRLDRAAARDVADLLRATAGADNQTVLCATHDPELIERAEAVIELC
jgi:ABC-type lipoprotein export system ATPase subunit